MPLFDFRNLYLGLAVVYFREVKTLQESLEAQVIIWQTHRFRQIPVGILGGERAECHQRMHHVERELARTAFSRQPFGT